VLQKHAAFVTFVLRFFKNKGESDAIYFLDSRWGEAYIFPANHFSQLEKNGVHDRRQLTAADRGFAGWPKQFTMQRFEMNISIRWKLIFTFLALTVGIFLLVEFFIGSGMRDLFEKRERQALSRDCRIVANVLAAKMEQRSSAAEIDSLAQRLGEILEARVIVYDSSGRVMALGDGAAFSAEREGRPLEVQKVLQGGPDNRSHATTEGDLLHYAYALQRGGRNIGVIRLSRAMDSISQSVIYRMVSLTGFVCVVLVLALSVFISGRIADPLQRMVRFANQVAANHFDKKLFVQNKDELGELAAALNGMSQRLSRTLEQITSERNHLQAILSGMEEGVLVTDLQGRIFLTNPSFKNIFNIAGPVEGKSVLEIVRHVTLQKALAAAIKNRRATAVEFSTNEAPPKFLEVHVVPFGRAGYGDRNGASGLVAVFHDVTELKQLERVRRDFIANVSHELRTPLTSIKGFTETLLDVDKIDADQARQFLETISRNVDRMSRMVEDLLEISRLESQQFDEPPSALELTEFIHAAVRSFQEVGGKKSITIQTEVPDEVPQVLATERTLEQVLANLLENAVKYTPEGGHVTVRAVTLPQEVIVHIQDTGVGIPSVDLDRIFERFYRVEKGRSTDSGGTGLGLSIVKHSLQAIGGRVWAESVLNAGSTFSFALRRADAAVVLDEQENG
jgi:two-component system phosphate regulon sensor histidine kinase PhoR